MQQTCIEREQEPTELAMADGPLQIRQVTKIWPYRQIVHAQTRNCPRKWDPQNTLGFWGKSGLAIPGQITRPISNKQEEMNISACGHYLSSRL